MLEAGSIKLVSIIIQGGASNIWGKPTGYDTELDGRKVQPTETVLYGKNLALAKVRAQKCYDAMIPKLQAMGVKTTGNQAAVTAVVYNTNGQLNKEAQNITVSVGFNWLTPKDIDFPDIKKPFILTGTYRCLDGKSGAKNEYDKVVFTDTTAWQDSIKDLSPEQRKDPNRILAFEVKWNANVLKNPWKTPWYRWVFYYGTDGKIKEIKGKVYDNTLNQGLQNYFKNNDNVQKKDPGLLKMLEISGYDKIITPYM